MSSLLLFLIAFAIVAAPAKKKEATEKLLAACAEGEADDIVKALAAGADPDARAGERKAPALMLAATNSLWGKEKAVVAAFVKAKVNLEAANADGTTPLMAAAATGRAEMIDELLAAGARLDTKDKDGWTALHYAVNNDKFQVADRLIAAKANLNAADNDKWTPMMIALDAGHGGIGEKLLKAGAKFPASWPDGASSLIHAVAGRDLAAVRLALANNPKINEPLADDGFTPVEIAAFDGDAQIVMELLRAGADASIKDKKGKTALDRAVEQERTEVAALLGGAWNKPKPKGGQTISIPCPALGGTVESNLALDGKVLVFTTTFPKPMSYYFGGGHMNRAETATRFTFDGSFAPSYYLDTDSNPKTGRKARFDFEKEVEGSEYAVEYSEYGTSITLSYLNSKGEERQKQVYGNVLDVSVRKGEESVDISDLGDDMPRAVNDNGVLRSRVPLAILALKPGSSMRVTAKIGSCKQVSATVAVK
ncbi:MAG TPA: ankyrin repeat domain-containing protein [Thermoanaerobaculia bacterium]